MMTSIIPGLLCLLTTIDIIGVSALEVAEFQEGNETLREPKGFFASFIENRDRDCRGNNGMGICTSGTKCRGGGATRLGRCGDGETCCSFPIACAVDTPCDIRRSGSRIQIGANAAGRYTIRLQRPKGVEQVHLEFMNSALAPPSNVAPNIGNCIVEFLTVTGSPTINNQLTVCGALTDQNMYLAFGNGNTITLAIQRAANANSIIDILVSFVDRKYRQVPLGCLQSYTSGQVVRSFGFPRQLNNQIYTVCFDPGAGNVGQSVVLTPCDGDGMLTDFGIMGDTNPDSIGYQQQAPAMGQMQMPNQAFAGDIAPCTRDWIQLYGTRMFCDLMFPANGITSTFHPFQLAVNFDPTEIAGTGAYSFPVPAGGAAQCAAPSAADAGVEFTAVATLCYSPCQAIPVLPPAQATMCTCQELTVAQILALQDLIDPAGAVERCRRVFGMLRNDNGNQGFCLDVNIN